MQYQKNQSKPGITYMQTKLTRPSQLVPGAIVTFPDATTATSVEIVSVDGETVTYAYDTWAGRATASMHVERMMSLDALVLMPKPRVRAPDGSVCKGCAEFVYMAAPNQDDGVTFYCRPCRQRRQSYGIQ